MKQVKNQLGKEVKKIFLLNHIFKQLEQGSNPSTIAKNLDLSKQNINYYIRQLKKKGLIEKVGYGTWEVKKTSKKSTKDGRLNIIKEERGHAFIWRVKLHKKPDYWDKRKEYLSHKQIMFKEVGITQTPRIILNNRKIWLANSSLIIYEPSGSSFFGVNSIEAKKLAINSLLETLREFEWKFNIDLKPYTFTTSRQHYSLIKNLLAIQCNEKGEKIHIFDEGKRWLVVDDSLEQGGELEVENEFIMSKKLQDWWNDHKKNKFGVTPSFVLEAMNGIQKNQVVFDRNMASHIKAVQKLGDGVNEYNKSNRTLNKHISELTNVIKELSLKNTHTK